MKPTRPRALLGDLRQLIAEARQDVARQVNSALVLLYWRVGTRIRQDILKEKRADYGRQIVSAVGRELTDEFGQGFSEKSLWHMIRFAEVFPDEKIVSALRRELSWTHFRQIKIFISMILLNELLNATSMPRFAELSAGAPARWRRKLPACSSSGLRCRRSRRS